jgi:hypothetical protein
MDILSLVDLWTPFTIYVASTTTPDPAYYHELVGATSQLYVLVGPSTERYDLAGPAATQYTLEGCRE